MINIQDFYKVVNTVPDNISPLKANPEKLYTYLGLPADVAYTIGGVSNELYRKIRGSFSTERTLIWKHCRQLENEVILDHVLNQGPLEPQLSVLACIRDAMLQPSQGLATDDWQAAICHALDKIRVQPLGNAHHAIHGRQFAVSFAALKLRQRGFQISIQNDRPYLSQSEELRIIAQLEKHIRAIGGLQVVAHIFDAIKKAYDPLQQRHHIVRESGGTLPKLFEPQVPLGYVLSLAVKSPLSPPPHHHSQNDWAELIELSKEYCSLFNVQPHGHYDSMFKDSTNLIPFIQEIALYDTLFALPQLRPHDAIKINYGVLDWIKPQDKFGGGWSISDVLTVMAAVFKLAKEVQIPKILSSDEIVKECKGLTPKLILKILDQTLSHPMPGANQKYSVPNEAPWPDFYSRPLLSLGNGRYGILNSSVCASAIMDALVPAIKAVYPDVSSQIGYAIERFLQHEFQTKGVITHSGKYTASNRTGECDLVIETNDTIFFIEAKKRSLTDKSRAGADIALLFDLLESLLKAQIQAGWHEIMIKKDGFLDLTDKNNRTYRLSLNGRNVERIAVSLSDYGGFHDRIFLKHFFEINTNAQYNLNNPSHQINIARLNDKLSELNNQARELIKLSSLPAKQPFGHCWFLSIPQILILLDSVTNNEEFKAALHTGRNVFTGTLDFYADYSRMKNLLTQKN